jgi:hypothetical protein
MADTRVVEFPFAVETRVLSRHHRVEGNLIDDV